MVASYLLIIFVTLSVAAGIFSLAVGRYMERQARASLLDDARAIAAILKNNMNDNTITESSIRQILKNRLTLRKEFGAIDSEWAIVGANRKLLYPRTADSAAEKVKSEILPQLSESFSKKRSSSVRIHSGGLEYMASVLPVKREASTKIAAWIVLYTPVGSLDQITRGINLVLLAALLVTGLVAVVFGVFFARSIARPVVLLKNRAEKLAQRDFDSRVEIHSGDELEELAETLEHMALELKRYDLAQKRFVQNASHELKTPLMSIQGYAEGLKDGVFEEPHKALDVIIEESTRLKKLVEELIFLSKLETMEDFYEYKEQSLNPVLEKSVEKVHSLAVKESIAIDLHTEGEVSMRLDHDKLTQAFINILGNCLRYAKQKIDISVKHKRKHVEITIRDDGDGFDDVELEHVFKRFYKGKKGCHGLGLAITKAIIEKHDGTIQVSNAAEGGAQFTICLPLGSGL